MFFLPSTDVYLRNKDLPLELFILLPFLSTILLFAINIHSLGQLRLNIN